MLHRWVFWTVFFLFLILRLQLFLNAAPPKPSFRNSEILFLQYREQKTPDLSSVHPGWKPFPHLHALHEAVWKGNLSFFPEQMREFYFYSGTLPLLALSGQHVIVLIFVLKVLLHFFSECLFLWRWDFYIRLRSYFWRGTREALFVFGATVLFFSSDGNASALRTLALYTAVFTLAFWFKFTSKVQCLTTSAAVLVFFHPPWIFQVGFVLSFLGVLVLFLLERKNKRILWLFPVFMAPLTAYFFGKVFFASFLVAVPLAVIWNMVWIPLGFLLPFFLNTGGAVFLPWLEKSFRLFCESHSWSVGLAHSIMIRVGVPSLLEVIVLEFWVLGAALFLLPNRANPFSTP